MRLWPTQDSAVDREKHEYTIVSLQADNKSPGQYNLTKQLLYLSPLPPKKHLNGVSALSVSITGDLK